MYVQLYDSGCFTVSFSICAFFILPFVKDMYSVKPNENQMSLHLVNVNVNNDYFISLLLR